MMVLRMSCSDRFQQSCWKSGGSVWEGRIVKTAWLRGLGTKLGHAVRCPLVQFSQVLRSPFPFGFCTPFYWCKSSVFSASLSSHLLSRLLFWSLICNLPSFIFRPLPPITLPLPFILLSFPLLSPLKPPSPASSLSFPLLPPLPILPLYLIY